MTLFNTSWCAACAGLPLLAASLLLVSQSGSILWPFSPLIFVTFISTHLSWSCLDLPSVTFDMTLAIGDIVTLRGTATLVVTSLIRLVYGVFGLWIGNIFHLGTVMWCPSFDTRSLGGHGMRRIYQCITHENQKCNICAIYSYYFIFVTDLFLLFLSFPITYQFKMD